MAKRSESISEVARKKAVEILKNNGGNMLFGQLAGELIRHFKNLKLKLRRDFILGVVYHSKEMAINGKKVVLIASKQSKTPLRLIPQAKAEEIDPKVKKFMRTGRF